MATPLYILDRFINRIEFTMWNPRAAKYGVVLKLADIVKSALLDSPEEEVTPLVDRFWDWASRRVITATEAALFYGKSRSTIYRWIKAEKLRAKKISGKWQIIL